MAYANFSEWLERLGQNQLLGHLKGLSPEARKKFEAQLQDLDWPVIGELLKPAATAVTESALPQIEPIIPHPVGDNAKSLFDLGEEFIRSGKLALFTLAGGQGSRLGFEGPKGCFGITPVRQYSLFGVFAEKILASERRYDIEIPWGIMTSSQNFAEISEFFHKKNFFGLKKDQVRFFVQGALPIVDAQSGNLILESPESLSLAPDGTGGAIKALKQSGTLDWWEQKGCSTISYIQVDNPLVKAIDPLFLGVMLQEKSQFVTKAVLKTSPEEKVGVYAKKNGAVSIIEYIDLPKHLSEAKGDDGKLLYSAGSIAVHAIEIDFINRVAQEGKLPYHRAHKREPFWDGQKRVTPQKPNAYKFEQFFFEVLPMAKNVVVCATERSEEFSPAKNAEGVDSPAWARRDQLRLWAKWLKKAGVEVPLDAEGTPTINFEITPLFADSANDILTRMKEGKIPPKITEGMLLS